MTSEVVCPVDPNPLRLDAAGYTVHVLILAEPSGPLHVARLGLEHQGYCVSMFYEEGHALATILHAKDKSLVLLCSRFPPNLLCVPRLIDRLRLLHYDGDITFCTRDLTPTLRHAYEALGVDACVRAQEDAPLSQVVSWLAGREHGDQRSLSIFEV